MPVTVVEGRRLSLSHLDKLYFPESGTLKGEVIQYYAQLQPVLLPHLRDRPLSFLRCPDGVDGQRFFAKSPPAGTPDWVRTTAVPSHSGDLRQVLVDDGPTLIWAANLGCIEFHVPQWHSAEPAVADRLVLDLDPGEGSDILTCRTVARLLRDSLAEDGLRCWVKTSGSKGLHLLVPLRPAPSEAVSAYAKALAARLERAHPDLVVHTMGKARRAGRVLVDWSQNNAKKTTAAPYTVRARPRPTVSTPVGWDELDAAGSPEDLAFTIADVPDRIARYGDLLAPLLSQDQAHPLPEATPGAEDPPARDVPRAKPSHAEPAARAEPSRAEPATTGPRGAEPLDEALVLEPPVEVMRPTAVRSVPEEDALGGQGVVYELKLDGFRCLAFARGERGAYLQSRSGRDLASEFPAIAAAVDRLPAGLVLDAELVAWRDGRFAFEELLHTRQARASEHTALGLIAFDVLAVPGQDVRALPLTDRRRLLATALADTAPPIQTVMATTSRAEALSWLEHLAPTGVEGLVCKAAASPYRARGAGRLWLKFRPADTVDATVTAVTGSPSRPRNALVRLDDGLTLLTSPRLNPVESRALAEAVEGRLGEPVRDAEHGTLLPLPNPLRVEVRLTGGRTGARFVRVRGD